MTDREFCDALRVKALQLVEDAARRLRLNSENTRGSMAAHVALEEVYRLKALCRQLDALADVAGTLKR